MSLKMKKNTDLQKLHEKDYSVSVYLGVTRAAQLQSKSKLIYC